MLKPSCLRPGIFISTSDGTNERAGVTRPQLPAWAPLRSPLFRALWLATLASNIGTWMHDVAAAWLMTSLSPNPQMNALVSAATTFPMFLLALPAGALADIVDRRKVVIATQMWAALVASSLAVLTLFSLTGPYVLLFFTLMMGIGGAIAGPAWQALIPEMVNKRYVPAAMSLGGVAWNMSRIVGPLIGGFIIGRAALYLAVKATAPGIVFAINAVSFVGVVIVFVNWRRKPREVDMPPEHIMGAMRTGWRYVRHSRNVRAILIHTFAIMIFLSVLFALLPLYTRQVLKLDATGYASLLCFIGVAGIFGNASFPRMSRLFSTSQLLLYSNAATAVNLIAIGLAPRRLPLPAAIWLVRFSLLLGGFAWPLATQTCNVNILRSVPDWVRSRATGTWVLVFMGSSAMGSIIWGQVAKRTADPHVLGSGLPIAFLCGGIGLLVGAIALRAVVIVDPGNADLSTSMQWPGALLSFEPIPEQGPVLVTREYRVDETDIEPFVESMHALRRLRLRDGALRWHLFQDTAEPDKWLETVLAESWNDYLRQSARFTVFDRAVEERARSFHRGSEPPLTSHLVASSARVRPEEPDSG